MGSNAEMRELLGKIQGKNYDEVKKVIAKMPNYKKDHIMKIITSKEHFETIKNAPNYKELRDRRLSVDLFQFLYSPVSTQPTDDPFVEFKVGEADFEGMYDLYKKEEKARTYQNASIKGIKEHWPKEYKAICAAFDESEMDPYQMEYLGSRRYLYRGSLYISFEDSPVQIILSWK